MSTRRERDIERDTRHEAWQTMDEERSRNRIEAHRKIQDNTVIYICHEHGESCIEFSMIDDGIGIIDHQPTCPVCGNEEGEARSVIPYRVEIPQRWSEEEY